MVIAGQLPVEVGNTGTRIQSHISTRNEIRSDPAHMRVLARMQDVLVTKPTSLVRKAVNVLLVVSGVSVAATVRKGIGSAG